jgi:nitrogen fixation protein NifU and related proteins
MSGDVMEELYREVILDHYRSPRGRGELPVPPAIKLEGFNPLCGDELTLYLEIVEGRVDRLRTQGRGCAISTASSSMMVGSVEGLTLVEVREKVEVMRGMLGVADSAGEGVELGELRALAGVARFPARIKCAMLGWTTLESGAQG